MSSQSEAPVESDALQHQNARFAIDGAIAWGMQDLNRPPAGHWLTEYWDIGHKLATVRWVPVGELLPPREFDVLLAVGGGVVTGFQIDQKFFAIADGVQIYPTHWMHVPSAPSSEAKA
ncbi:hypothetical protein [Pandoraea sputorum]|uniref:hypothetical protein n=1 Tax=Pandoraea sputorum TaxID=93222 RepID=UPI002F40322F